MHARHSILNNINHLRVALSMGKKKEQLERSQTAIEYLLLIGSSVIFTIIVTLAARDVIWPLGPEIIHKTDLFASAKASFGASTPTISIPSAIPPSPSVEVLCNPGDPCGIDVCVGNSYCKQICSPARTCGIDATSCVSCLTSTFTNSTCPDETYDVAPCQTSCDNTCSSGACVACDPPKCDATCTKEVPSCTIVSDRNNEPGPFISTITATFKNLDAGITHADLSCYPGDLSSELLIASGSDRIATKSCDYFDPLPMTYPITANADGVSCSSTVTISPPPATCEVLVEPPEGSTRTDFQVTVAYDNILFAPSNKADIRCNQNGGPSTYVPINDITRTASLVCNYPVGGDPPNYEYVIDASTQKEPFPYCFSVIKVRQAMSCTINGGDEPREIGAFGVDVMATFTNLEPGIDHALIRCNETDPGELVLISLVNDAAERRCDYPSVTETKMFVANASVCGDYSCAMCTMNIIDDPLPYELSDICDVNKCDISTKPLNGLNPYIDFMVLPDYGPSPDEIRIMDSSISCNNMMWPCKGKPQGCRVRGSRLGSSYCALIEDLSDYDWNDYIFSANIITYSANDRLVEVTDEFCSSAAANKLKLMFDFASSNYTRDMEEGDFHYGTSKDYEVWPNCQGYMGRVRHFFVSNINNPPNFPPTWSTIPEVGFKAPLFFVGQTRSIPALGYATDDHSAWNLVLGLVKYDPNLLDCWLTPLGVPNPTHVTCKALASGTSWVRVSATDESGYYTTTQFAVKVF